MSPGVICSISLEAHVIDPDGGVEREAREDRHLRRRVGAADVIGRVGFGVAETLRLAKRRLVAAAQARHLREDEVCRAVDDPVNPLDPRPGERLPQHPDHRHDAGDSRLEAERQAALTRQCPELVAVTREQLFVRGDNVAPGLQRAADVVERLIDAADQLDDQIGALEDLLEVAARTRQHTTDLRLAPGQLRDALATLGEQLLEGAADGAVAEQADPQRAHTGYASRAWRSSSVSRRTTTRASPSLAKTTGGRGTPL